MTTKIEKQDLVIRWMIRRDLPDVLAIEADCFDESWSEAEFIKQLRRRNVIGMCVEFDGDIIGFMIYELQSKHIEVTNFAVDEAYQRRGVGAAMVERLREKFGYGGRRDYLLVMVPEDYVEMQLFLRETGFKCSFIWREYFENTMSAYQFQWFVPGVIPYPHAMPDEAVAWEQPGFGEI